MKKSLKANFALLSVLCLFGCGKIVKPVPQPAQEKSAEQMWKEMRK